MDSCEFTIDCVRSPLIQKHESEAELQTPERAGGEAPYFRLNSVPRCIKRIRQIDARFKLLGCRA
jgi:hypothetical protein